MHALPRTDASDGATDAPDGSFDELVLPHRGALFAYALRCTRNPRDAEDLVQDALMRAYAAWPRFIRGSNARAWVYRILTNSFINGCRRRKRYQRFAQETPHDAMSALYGDRPREARDPEGAMLEGELSDDVLAALAALSDDYREVVVLADLAGVPYKQIAAQLGVPIGTVMSRLFRARRQLEQQLAGFAAETYGIRRAADAVARAA